MLATEFTRDRCQLGHKRVTYACLEREYRCNGCGGRITSKWSQEEGWRPECGACGSQDFIHECEYQRQTAEAREVLDGLPEELAEVLGPARAQAGPPARARADAGRRRQHEPLPFKEARALLHPPIVEI